MTILELRNEYHHQICSRIIRVNKNNNLEYPNFADVANESSRNIAWGIVRQMGCPLDLPAISPQTAGQLFERITKDFLQAAFDLLHHLRPGKWIYSTHSRISEFEQYEHLAYLDEVIQKDKKLASALKGSYIIIPDIIVARQSVTDEQINEKGEIIKPSESVATLTPFRQSNRPGDKKILHASISCKWTMRSDRAQNTRTEALNLIRNRKGRVPLLVSVTAEPTVNRLASLALGTGDLDCVYHFALYELIESTKALELTEAYEELQMMIEGRRLRDISDLPFDLAI